MGTPGGVTLAPGVPIRALCQLPSTDPNLSRGAGGAPMPPASGKAPAAAGTAAALPSAAA
eukprot:6543989-Lingulodinium_polyedra.AAC.1